VSGERVPRRGTAEQVEVARQLRALLEAVERGELDAPATLLAYLSGALAALEHAVPARPD
jgi:hypothetical protein